MCRQTKFDLKSVEKVAVTLYDDFSSLDGDNCYVQLKSGAKWVLDADPVLLFAAELVPELPASYKAIAWEIPESCRYDDEEEYQLRNYDVDVLFGPDPTSVNSDRQLRSYLEALLSCERKYQDDVWWGEKTVGHELVRSALLDGKCTMLQEMLVGHCHEERAPFLLAVAIVEGFDQSCAQNSQPLIAMLMGEQSPLNDHWKSILAGKVRV